MPVCEVDRREQLSRCFASADKQALRLLGFLVRLEALKGVGFTITRLLGLDSKSLNRDLTSIFNTCIFRQVLFISVTKEKSPFKLASAPAIFRSSVA